MHGYSSLGLRKKKLAPTNNLIYAQGYSVRSRIMTPMTSQASRDALQLVCSPKPELVKEEELLDEDFAARCASLPSFNESFQVNMTSGLYHLSTKNNTITTPFQHH